MSIANNWNEAREFSRNTIGLNPRLSDREKSQLYIIETEAYQNNMGRWFQDVTSEIDSYFRELRVNFADVTNDERFLAVFQSAQEQAQLEDEITESIIEETVEETAKKVSYFPYLIAAGAVFYLIRK